MMRRAPISRNRLEALCDGVYAVALTLLALDLKLPPLADVTAPVLHTALVALLPKGLMWALSFWVAALFWVAQNRILRAYACFDGAALLIEFAQLALVTLLPFSTALIGEHGDLVAAALIYSVHLSALAALSVVRVVRLLQQPSLRSTATDALHLRAQLRRSGVLLACTLLAVALAPFWPGWNMLAMLGLLLHRALPQPRP